MNTIAASCPNTVVITNSGGLNVLPFANHPNVTAILAAHYSGQVSSLHGCSHLPSTDDRVYRKSATPSLMSCGEQ